MKFIFKLLTLFFVCESQGSATSNSFEQNFIFNNNNQSLKMNDKKSMCNFNTLAITSSINIIGEKLYHPGFCLLLNWFLLILKIYQQLF